MEEFIRTQMLIGEANLKKLQNSRVAVFGLGGVGGYAIEALARSGIGSIDLVDNDKISPSNINRQIYALNSTIGKFKTDVAKMRVLDINPDIKVKTYATFYDSKTQDEFDFSEYDYIIDAIDTVSSKILLVENAIKTSTPIISSMGTGNKLNPMLFKVDDIYKTSVCPLARVMRHELKKRNIKNLKVLYSTETPIKIEKNHDEITKKQIPASISFVPSVAGLILAGVVIQELLT